MCVHVADRYNKSMQAMAVSVCVELSQDDGMVGGFSHYRENMRRSGVSLQRGCESHRSSSWPNVQKIGKERKTKAPGRHLTACCCEQSIWLSRAAKVNVWDGSLWKEDVHSLNTGKVDEMGLRIPAPR